MNADSSAFTMPAWVVHMPCGNPSRILSLLSLSSFADRGAEFRDGHDLIIVAM